MSDMSHVPKIHWRVPTRRVKASTAPGFKPGFCFGLYIHSVAGFEVSIALYTLSNKRLHNLRQCEQTGMSLEHRSFRFLQDAHAG